MSDGLFTLPAGAVVVPDDVPKLSADRRRTRRQTLTLEQGRHPLGGRLHNEAAPVADRTAAGRRCGNCWYRRLIYTNGNKLWPKCHLDMWSSLRITGGPATDCRSWWPACTEHSYGEPSMSEDAARWVPPPSTDPATGG